MARCSSSLAGFAGQLQAPEGPSTPGVAVRRVDGAVLAPKRRDRRVARRPPASARWPRGIGQPISGSLAAGRSVEFFAA